jgi:glutamate synthase domain-containing protein 2
MEPEFWNVERIEHIRYLARFGKPLWVWDRAKQTGNRILDRIRFRAELEDPGPDPSPNPSADTSTSMAYDRIEMTTPLYLGDMSFGALSGIPNIALARTADITGIVTGTGEGGLHPEVRKCRRITVQWASARFGVDIDVLNTGLGIVIKIGQGAKPGIGGHLPGVKVTKPISETRRIPVGLDAISPAPHHDIYSIEDLGQRIAALKEATGKPVFVKVGVTNYIAYIAAGVARMGADGIIMDGQGAGTGAAPAVVRDNIGLPIEIAVPVVDQALRREGLRDGFTVVAAGRVSSAEDTAKLIALGADVVSLGTAALIAMGCVMVHKCHLGFCPTLLTNKIEENPAKILSLETATRWAVNMVYGWTEELKNILDAVGVSSVRELVGRRDLLLGLNVGEDELRLMGVRGA